MEFNRISGKVLIESSEENIEDCTKKYLDKLDYSNSGKTTSELFWLGTFIANQFCRCNATESRKKLHEMNPHTYKEVVEDKRLEKIVKSVDLYEKAVLYHKNNFSPKDAFNGLLDIETLREPAVKALINGVKFANNKKDNIEKETIISVVKSLLDSLNINIELYNTRALRPVEKIKEIEIGV